MQLQLHRIGRVNESRYLYVHEDEGSVYFTMDIDPTNFEDWVGPDDYQKYLIFVDAVRHTGYAESDYTPYKKSDGLVKRLLGKLGVCTN